MSCYSVKSVRSHVSILNGMSQVSVVLLVGTRECMYQPVVSQAI
jgi:hypothetical protein